MKQLADPIVTEPSESRRSRARSEEIAHPAERELRTQNTLESRGNTQKSVPAPVRSTVRVFGQIDVTAVQDPELRERIIGHLDPRQLIDMTTREIGEDLRVTRVGLGCAGIQISGAAHLQPGHIRDRDLKAAGDHQ
jgi:hypothetical protein